jgi:dihydrofolate reductase
MIITLVVIMAKNRVIGRGNAMPWRMPSDLKHFRATTMGKPMVMGRKTFQSIGKVLDGRATYVVTRQSDLVITGAHVVSSIEHAINAERAKGTPELAIVGGGELYALALPTADRIIATIIDAAIDGDTYFPLIDEAVWRQVNRTPLATGPKDDYAAVVVTYERRR